MTNTAQNLSSPIYTVESQPSPESIYQIIKDALSDPHSAVNNKDHPYRDQAVKSLRRLQLQLMDPSHPTISELDLKRLNMSVYKAEQMQSNIRHYGTAIGNRANQTKICIGSDEETGQPVYRLMTKQEHSEFIQQIFCSECNELHKYCECVEVCSECGLEDCTCEDW